MLANLSKWTGDASNLTGLARVRSASTETHCWEADPAAGAEAAFLDGAATDSDPDGITQPGERLAVYNLAGYGEPLFLSEVLITSKSLAKEAAALAFMRRGPYDVRPSLLLLMVAQDVSQVSTCSRYAVNYLRAWCARRKIDVPARAVQFAAIDALSILCRLRVSRSPARATPSLVAPSTKVRAKSQSMREETYRRLRAVTLSALQDRYLEGVAGFSAALGQVRPARSAVTPRSRMPNLVLSERPKGSDGGPAPQDGTFKAYDDGCHICSIDLRSLC